MESSHGEFLNLFDSLLVIVRDELRYLGPPSIGYVMRCGPVGPFNNTGQELGDALGRPGTAKDRFTAKKPEATQHK